MSAFDNTYSFKLIYVLRVNDEKHKGLLKVGDATLHTDTVMEQLPPNCPELNEAARERIKQYTKTLMVQYDLLHTELAVRVRGGMHQPFRDKIVHTILRNSGVEIIKHNEGKGQSSDWVKADFATVLKAIAAAKANHQCLEAGAVSRNQDPIVLRPEQEEAVQKTCKRFKKHTKMLWNAKMRFGKTLCALYVVKRMQYKRTLILTHRPVVSDGWFDDFFKVFVDGEKYYFGSRVKGRGLPFDSLRFSCERYIYFASIQDLRGSALVGGTIDKNNALFNTDWDCVIIDEAHEGTQTSLGRAVTDAVVKKDTRVLRLSGTPFNLLDEFNDDEIYTWDYVMEQKAKLRWYETHLGDPNPYAELPQLNIHTYDLKRDFQGYEDLEDKAFNFREFFRVWTGDAEQDGRVMPDGAAVGDFVHKKDVKKFLNLQTKNGTNYPFATEEYQQTFRHTLWILPGVKEVRAMKALMEEHPVFGSGAFTIVNVAGEGDDDNEDRNALENVRRAIGKHPEETYSITLSCGRLTAGVTVPEWSAVMMLAGSYSTSAAQYLQTIFRVQSPGTLGGRVKEKCFAFDFAPDRTLRMVAEAGKLDTRAGRGTKRNEREHMQEFLNFCPVISYDGSIMREYDVNHMLRQLKRFYVEHAVRSGFDDKYIYNEELMKLDHLSIQDFKKLRKVIGTTKQTKQLKEIVINHKRFDSAEYDKAVREQHKPEKELTPEELKRREMLAEQRRLRETAISILRGISIRIPLLIYGADIGADEDITVEALPSLIDEESWQEFMPRGVTKALYSRFTKYYDPDVFVAAGHRIRELTKGADDLPPTARVKRIAEIMSMFKNPDKETVLTPWRVVNMHLGDCLGGYDFFDATHENALDVPRLVNHGAVTASTLANENARILELNAKTGLYSLYATYSLMRIRCRRSLFENASLEQREWDASLNENIFVICRTKMGCNIARRTLIGYRDIRTHIRYYHNLLDTIKDDLPAFARKVTKPSFYNSTISGKMKFNAIIGNPPYQLNDGSGASVDAASPLYDDFFRAAKEVKPDYISLIMPSRWMVGGRQKLKSFRNEMMKERRFMFFRDFEDAAACFPGQHIDGGICYFLWAATHDGQMRYCYQRSNGEATESVRYLADGGKSIVIRDMNSSRVSLIEKAANGPRFNSIVSPTKPFGIRKDLFNKPDKYKAAGGSDKPFEDSVMIWGVKGIKGGAKRKTCYVKRAAVTKNEKIIDLYKLFFTTSYSTGAINPPEIVRADPGTVCTETFLLVGPFKTKAERDNCYAYMNTRFFKVLLSFGKGTMQVNQDTFNFIPMVDFSKKWTDIALAKHFKLAADEQSYINSLFAQ